MVKFVNGCAVVGKTLHNKTKLINGLEDKETDR